MQTKDTGGLHQVGEHIVESQLIRANASLLTQVVFNVVAAYRLASQSG